MKHNSECKPDFAKPWMKGHPSLMECYLSNNRQMWMLYYQADRERDKFLEWFNWCIREGKKIRGLPMPDGWEV
ncbi:hypothetical protein M0R72_15845 [Candidatus Pacearchaeota archaeon]|jgi:hypothetical protein|nr:hypothetical protein [Candidatus Pacearchaeota archaeon]